MDDSLMYGQENFTLPHDVVALPSQGKFYKNKQKTVKVGYLTAADENILMGSNAEDMIMTLVRNKVYEPNLRPDDMLNGDIEAILIFLRNTSFGPEYNISVVDPKTQKRFQTKIMLDSIDFKKTQVEPNERGTFNITLPKSGAALEVRPLTYKEIREITTMAESYPQGRVAPKVSWRLQKQIVSVNGETDGQTIARFIEGLPIMDSKYIRNFLLENEPSLDLMQKVYTPSGETVDVDINFGVEFFRVFF